jgi:hypothetical protein
MKHLKTFNEKFKDNNYWCLSVKTKDFGPPTGSYYNLYVKALNNWKEQDIINAYNQLSLKLSLKDELYDFQICDKPDDFDLHHQPRPPYSEEIIDFTNLMKIIN